MEAAVYEEIARLQDEPVPAEELQKVKNAFKANAYRRLSSPFAVFMQLVTYDALGRLAATSTRSAERGRRGHRRRPPARGEGVPDEGEPDRRHLPAQGGRHRPRTRSSPSSPPPAQTMVRQALAADRGGDGPGEARGDGGADAAGGRAGAAGDEAGARADPEEGLGAPGRAPGEPEVRTAMKRTTPASPSSCSRPRLARGARRRAGRSRTTRRSSPSGPSPSSRRRGEGPPRRAEERHGRVRRRGPGAAAGQRVDHRAHGQLARARRQGGHSPPSPARRCGGAARRASTAEQLDERLDFLAAQVGTGIGATSGSAVAQLPRRQPRRGAAAVRGDARGAALPGGPPRAGEGAGPAGDEEAQRRLRRHRGPRVGRAPLRAEPLHEPLHHRGLGPLDHSRRHAWPSTAGTSTRPT